MINSWANYLAIDADGDQWEYENKPIFNRQSREWEHQGGRVHLVRHSKGRISVEDAAASLVERQKVG
jgi:hypothetical protein